MQPTLRHILQNLIFINTALFKQKKPHLRNTSQNTTNYYVIIRFCVSAGAEPLTTLTH